MKSKILIVFFLIVFITCGNKKSAIREMMNNPANGYIQEIDGNGYQLNIQYQPAEFRADQEIMINKSEVNKSQLIKEYDQLQQFLVKYKLENRSDEVDEMGLMFKFTLITNDSIPCIDAHKLPYSPGAPWHEVIILFPLTGKELGNHFKMRIADFPFSGNQHHIEFNLNKNS